MAKALLTDNGVRREAKKGFITVDGVYRKIKKSYITIDGVYELAFSGEITPPLFDGVYTISTVGDYVYMHLKSSGTLTIVDSEKYDLFAVGGGSAGEQPHQGTESASGQDGGAGGYAATLLNKSIPAGTYAVTIGSGGIAATKEVSSTGGSDTSIGDLITASGARSSSGTGYHSKNGGSGGGGAGRYDNGTGGAGGSDGGNGKDGYYSSGEVYEDGGSGQGTTTRAFGESSGTLYAGGGGGGGQNAGIGGAGGGGAGGYYSGDIGWNVDATSGAANTGGGGGGARRWSNTFGTGLGGSGIAIIRWKK